MDPVRAAAGKPGARPAASACPPAPGGPSGAVSPLHVAGHRTFRCRPVAADHRLRHAAEDLGTPSRHPPRMSRDREPAAAPAAEGPVERRPDLFHMRVGIFTRILDTLRCALCIVDSGIPTLQGKRKNCMRVLSTGSAELSMLSAARTRARRSCHLMVALAVSG